MAPQKRQTVLENGQKGFVNWLTHQDGGSTTLADAEAELDVQWPDSKSDILEEFVKRKTKEYEKSIWDVEHQDISADEKAQSVQTSIGMISRLKHEWEAWQARVIAEEREVRRQIEESRRRAEERRRNRRDSRSPDRNRRPTRERSPRGSPTVKAEDDDDRGGDSAEKQRTRYSVTPYPRPLVSSTERQALKRSFSMVAAGDDGVLERNGLGEERMRMYDGQIIDLT